MKSSLSIRSPLAQKGFAVANLLAFAVMITANCLSIFLPLNGKTQAQLSGQYPNLFTPAGYIFSIWSVIYMLLLGFIIYQFFILFVAHHRDKISVLYISPLFIGVCLCNAGWLFAWHYEFTTLSVLIMIIHLWLLILIHDRLSLAIAWWPLAPKLWMDIPFSIYLGWICVATIANITAWMVSKGIHLSFLLPQVWTIIMIIIALLVGMFYVFTRNNKFVAITIAWAFYGIISKRSASETKGSHTLVLATGLALGIYCSSSYKTVFGAAILTISQTCRHDFFRSLLLWKTTNSKIQQHPIVSSRKTCLIRHGIRNVYSRKIRRLICLM